MASRTLAAMITVLALNLFLVSALFSEAVAENPKALYLSRISDSSSRMLTEAGFDVDISSTLPQDLSQYRLVVANDIGSSLESSQEILRKYVRDGGGYAYISGAAYWSDLKSNRYWIGAGSVGYTGFGESAYVSVDNPLDTDLVSGDILKRQAEDEKGAQWVHDLEPGAVTLAEYSGGVYAYSYNYAAGRVFYQSDTGQSGAGGIAGDNAKKLFAAGIKWAAKLESVAALPPGTVMVSSVDRSVSDEEHRTVFSNPGAQTVPFPEPSSRVTAIVSFVTTYVEGAVLHFSADGEEYSHSVFPNTYATISFERPVRISDVEITIDGRGYPDDAGHVGYFYAPEDSFPLEWIVMAAAAAGGSITTFFVMRKRTRTLPDSGRPDVIQQDNEEKSAVLRELEGELGSTLRPASSMSELLGRFSHGKQNNSL